VVAGVVQERADWGVAIATVAKEAGLGFLPLQEEQFDFVIPDNRWDSPAVAAFRRLMQEADVRRALCGKGFRPAG
jgi:putative molybdopterin biosynthesis protein